MRGKAEVVELRVPSQAKYLAVVRQTIAGLADGMHFRRSAIEDIALAVSEACANVVKHAYVKRGSGNSIDLRCAMARGQLEILIQDRGRGFDVGKLKPYQKGTLALNAKGSVGVGLFLATRLMDTVEIVSRKGVGTRIRMVKRRTLQA